jgi:DNA-binding XRE family transcriptional regulator
MTPQEFRTLRRSKGWTQRQLSQLMQVSAIAVSYWETGRNGISAAVAAHVQAMPTNPQAQRLPEFAVDRGGEQWKRPRRKKRAALIDT